MNKKHWKPLVVRTCKFCGDTLRGRKTKFCCRECGKAYHNKLKSLARREARKQRVLAELGFDGTRFLL